MIFDPNRPREDEQKRKGDHHKRNKRMRTGVGGFVWTVEARLDEYLHFIASKVDSA